MFYFTVVIVNLGTLPNKIPVKPCNNNWPLIVGGFYCHFVSAFLKYKYVSRCEIQANLTFSTNLHFRAAGNKLAAVIFALFTEINILQKQGFYF